MAFGFLLVTSLMLLIIGFSFSSMGKPFTVTIVALLLFIFSFPVTYYTFSKKYPLLNYLYLELGLKNEKNRKILDTYLEIHDSMYYTRSMEEDLVTQLKSDEQFHEYIAFKDLATGNITRESYERNIRLHLKKMMFNFQSDLERRDLEEIAKFEAMSERLKKERIGSDVRE